MNIRDIMSNRVISVGQDESVLVAARQLKRSNIGALPVCDDRGRLRGIITDRDIVTRCIAAEMDPGDTKIKEIMSRGVVTASPDDTVAHAAKLMATDQIRRLPILEEGKIVGMVALCDLARNSGCDTEAAEALCEISSNYKKL